MGSHAHHVGNAVVAATRVRCASGGNRHVDGDDAVIMFRRFGTAGEVTYRVLAGDILLLVPLTGEIAICCDDVQVACPAPSAFLIAREGAAAVRWPDHARGLEIRLRRDQINAIASQARGDARRLLPVAALLEPVGKDAKLDALVAAVTRVDAGDADVADEVASRLHAWLLERLVVRDASDGLFTRVRAVGEAMEIVRGNPGGAHDTEALAAGVGVTAQTLRKGFRACLGMSVREFVQRARLDWAYATLSSGRDARTIPEIASGAGFTSGRLFSRAYVGRFGEPPSRTRARAVGAIH